MLQNWIRPLNEMQDREIYNKIGRFQPKSYRSELIDKLPKQCVAMVGAATEPTDLIRKELSKLAPIKGDLQIFDLGDLRSNSNDFIGGVLAELYMGQIPVILFGEFDHVINAQIQGHSAIGKKSKVGIMTSQSLDHIEDANIAHLEQLSYIGWQEHYSDPHQWSNFESIDIFRFNQLQRNIIDSEPYIRNTNLLTFDLNLVKSVEAPGQLSNSNTGLTANESCQLMHYAGFNAGLSSLSFCGYQADLDHRGMTAQFIAQMIWYYLSAAAARPDEQLDQSAVTQSYSIFMEPYDLDVTFVKSLVTGRWWLKTGDGRMTACSAKDYEMARENELSSRLLKFLQ